MKIYLETGFFIDYLSSRGHAGRYLRTSDRRGRSAEQLAVDAEACLTGIAAKHELCTSSLTFYEVDEAMYKQLAESAKGVSHAGRLVIPAARSVMVQMMMAVELFSVEVLSLDRGVVMEQLRQVDLQLKGVRAADSLHITSAIVSGAEIIVSGDDDMLKLDQQFRTPNGGIIRCLDTDIVLATLSEDSSPDQG
jgi:hypothetical protein